MLTGRFPRDGVPHLATPQREARSTAGKNRARTGQETEYDLGHSRITAANGD
jgi:hypothetical protein